MTILDMKKHYYLILAVLCSALLFSCKEPEPVVENKETSLKVEPALVKFTSAAASSSVNLTTESEAWEVFIKDAAWLKVSPETGNGNAEIVASTMISLLVSVNSNGISE